MAVPDDQEVELLSGAVTEGDPPAAAVLALGMVDRGLEADAVSKRERTGVAMQITEDLGVMWIVGVLVRPHRHVAERDTVPGGVDVERLVGGRGAVRIAEVPVPADVVARLEAGVGQ